MTRKGITPDQVSYYWGNKTQAEIDTLITSQSGDLVEGDIVFNTTTKKQLLWDGSIMRTSSGGSGDLLATLEQRVNNAQSGIGSSGSNDGILTDHTIYPWILSGSGTITSGNKTPFTLQSIGGLINVEVGNSYVLQDAAATASGKQEIVRVASVTYGGSTGAETVVITPEDNYTNSYAANFTFGTSGGLLRIIAYNQTLLQYQLMLPIIKPFL